MIVKTINLSSIVPAARPRFAIDLHVIFTGRWIFCDWS